jgi:hypothetical protein
MVPKKRGKKAFYSKCDSLSKYYRKTLKYHGRVRDISLTCP